MPRLSKEKQALISGKVYRFLMDRPDTKKKFKICSDILQSLILTPSNNQKRRKKYIQQLENCFKKLTSESTDLILFKKKLDKTSDDLERQSRKRCELQDRLLEVERLNLELSVLPERLEQQVALKHESEKHYAELLRENDTLRERIERLKQENKSLKESPAEKDSLLPNPPTSS